MASMAPELVSVIVPVYNGVRFLGECIGSLLRQDHPAIEVIVVDDGSSDGAAAVAEGFPGVRVLRRAHEGLAPTRNAGLEMATGTLIGFCDADDLWKAAKARRQIEYLARHPDTAIVLCRQETLFTPGTPRPDWLRPDQVRGDLDGIAATSGLFRRSVFEQLGGFRGDGILSPFDLELLVRARAAGLVIDVLEEVLTVRRIHDRNMTGDESLLPAMFKTVRDHLHGIR